MSGSAERLDLARILGGLKDFQRRTVDYAFDRMYVTPAPTRRFLVADEVGLGKTLIARGLVAKAIDHLWNNTDRIDIVYICSNSSIARQNITRLNVTGHKDFALASRITLLPTQLHQLTRRKLNFVSFTPGTSFDLRSSLGTSQERVLLLHLLQQAWNVSGAAPRNVMQGGARADRFRERTDSFLDWHDIEPTIAAAFVSDLQTAVAKQRAEGIETYREAFDRLCRSFSRSDSIVSREDLESRRHFVGALRGLLARTCVRALQPDLIILDEFQRFKHLLDDEDESSELSRALFQYSDEQTTARVLLLSATPYKMYTVDGEAGGDDHYDDFLATLRFLQDDPARTAACESLLKGYRRELLDLGGSDESGIRDLKAQLETELRRVIARTERLAVTADRDGMLTGMPTPATRLAPGDLRAYLGIARLADVIGHGDAMEYWKAAPYLLNFMEKYELRRKLDRHMGKAEGHADIVGAIEEAAGLLLEWKDIEAYKRVDPGNARLRWLVHRTIESGAWRLLWVPPGRPNVALGGAFADPALRRFTKTLVFSSWQVVPKAIAALVSYEAERLIMNAHEDSPENTAEARAKKSPLLRFVADAGGTAFTLVYPSFALGEAAERILRDAGGSGAERTAAEVVAEVAGAIKDDLDRLVKELASEAGEDEQWYWVAPVLLDRLADSRAASRWLAAPDLASKWTGEEGSDDSGDGVGGSSALGRVHIPRLQEIASGRPPKMGQPPSDLAEVLARMALAAPATAALRAIAGVLGGSELQRDPEIRDAAARIGWGFRNLFNVLEVTALVRGRSPDPYWRRVIDYCLDGCLDAVLQEYAHVLREWLGFVDLTEPGIAGELAETMTDALGLRTATLRVDDVIVDPARRDVSLVARGIRARFAVRLGEEDSEEGKRQERIDRIRKAFNSPFWPFVLATTSVGQEGLDFHLYCHAVAHWNLPSNPIDLEQREGRVHRYKGHAVRHNVALLHGRSPAVREASDPWAAMFMEARQQRAEHTTDLVPYWLYAVEGGVKIERHVPMLPLSRDVARLADLRESLALYRVVFGQPRQEDLLEYLLAQVPPADRERFAEELRIDVSPR